jgi:hypothetical protein
MSQRSSAGPHNAHTDNCIVHHVPLRLLVQSEGNVDQLAHSRSQRPLQMVLPHSVRLLVTTDLGRQH